MSEIDIQARHELSHDDAQRAAEELSADLAQRFGIDYGWEGDAIHFERPGVNGRIDVLPDTLRIRARLGFLLLALKPAIEQEIVRYLRDHFGCRFDS